MIWLFHSKISKRIQFNDTCTVWIIVCSELFVKQHCGLNLNMETIIFHSFLLALIPQKEKEKFNTVCYTCSEKVGFTYVQVNKCNLEVVYRRNSRQTIKKNDVTFCRLKLFLLYLHYLVQCPDGWVIIPEDVSNMQTKILVQK